MVSSWLSGGPPPITGVPAGTTSGYGGSMPEAARDSPEKDLEDWVTGHEPLTGPQHSYLLTLTREAGEDIPPDLTKAQTSELIDRPRKKTGCGR